MQMCDMSLSHLTAIIAAKVYARQVMYKTDGTYFLELLRFVGTMLHRLCFHFFFFLSLKIDSKQRIFCKFLSLFLLKDLSLKKNTHTQKSCKNCLTTNTYSVNLGGWEWCWSFILSANHSAVSRDHTVLLLCLVKSLSFAEQLQSCETAQTGTSDWWSQTACYFMFISHS